MAVIDRDDDKLSRKDYIEKYSVEKRDAQQFVNRASKIGGKRLAGKSGDYITAKDSKRKYIDLLIPIAREARKDGKTLESLSPKQASAILDRLAPNMNKRDVKSTRTTLEKSFRMMPKFRKAAKANGKPLNLRRCNLGKPDPPLKPRAMHPQCIKIVLETLSPRHRFAAELAVAGGLRAKELLTISPEEFQKRANRDWENAFTDKQHMEMHTVVGKGGRTHPKAFIKELADKLESLKLDEPRVVVDRGKTYTQKYDLSFGQKLSQAWGTASRKALGYSNGIHSVRHTYAVLRYEKFKALEMKEVHALAGVSKELGHANPKTSLTYLRG